MSVLITIIVVTVIILLFDCVSPIIIALLVLYLATFVVMTNFINNVFCLFVQENFPCKGFLLNSIKQGHFDGNFVSEICCSVGHQLEELMVEVGELKGKLLRHSSSLQEEGTDLFELVALFHKEITNLNESYEVLNQEIIHVESSEKEKDKELLVLRKNISLLLEAFSGSVMELESRKAELVGNTVVTGDLGINVKSADLPGGSFGWKDHIYSEESIMAMKDKLLLAVRDVGKMKAEIVEGGTKELKITITELQKQLNEKEVQKEMISLDLVSQIKEAKAAATRYSQDLQSSRSQVHDLEKQIEVIDSERNLLEQRVNELENTHATFTELQERVRSLTEVLASKDQGRFTFNLILLFCVSLTYNSQWRYKHCVNLFVDCRN